MMLHLAGKRRGTWIKMELVNNQLFLEVNGTNANLRGESPAVVRVELNEDSTQSLYDDMRNHLAVKV